MNQQIKLSSESDSQCLAMIDSSTPSRCVFPTSRWAVEFHESTRLSPLVFSTFIERKPIPLLIEAEPPNASSPSSPNAKFSYTRELVCAPLVSLHFLVSAFLEMHGEGSLMHFHSDSIEPLAIQHVASVMSLPHQSLSRTH